MADDTKPRIKLPPEYENEAEFLQEMREGISEDQLYDQLNRDAGTEDLKFVTGDQWEPGVKERRQRKRKPTLTVNRIPAFVAQVLGSRMNNETQVKVIPNNDSDVGIAKVREGLIRAIQRESKAQQAFDTALSGAVMAGIGNFRVAIDYENDEVWHMSIRIVPIVDHFGVVWDSRMTDATGEDATRVSVLERIPLKEFQALYPWAATTSVISANVADALGLENWYATEDVQIANYWRMRARKRTIALLTTGATIDITDLGDSPSDLQTLAKIAVGEDGEPMVRTIMRKYAQLYRCAGSDVLEGPYNLDIDRVPVFRVPGWEVRIGESTMRWGLVRQMKDPQRLHNYWRSAIAEKLMQTPRATWMASDAAIQGRERQWRESARSDDPLLVWNAESGQAPQRVPPAQMEAALITEAQMTAQDLKDVSNIHEANLGMPSNEVSGVAIQARVRVSDIGTAIYTHNLSNAIAEAGRVINALIPSVYDTLRTITVLAPDDQEMQVEIARGDAKHPDITVGKYRVTSTTGPSYDTKREQNREAMLSLAQALPATMATSADLLVESMDWPGAQKIADRIKRSLPPGLLSPADMTPEMRAQAAARGAAQDRQQQIDTMIQVHKTIGDYIKAQGAAAADFARADHYGSLDTNDKARTMISAAETESKTASRQNSDMTSLIKAVS